MIAPPSKVIVVRLKDLNLEYLLQKDAKLEDFSAWLTKQFKVPAHTVLLKNQAGDILPLPKLNRDFLAGTGNIFRIILDQSEESPPLKQHRVDFIPVVSLQSFFSITLPQISFSTRTILLRLKNASKLSGVKSLRELATLPTSKVGLSKRCTST
jgi:hypothetical protein